MTEQMEPERKIERLLRNYAKQRRGQAGDPLKLHPATRRMFQDEIARHAPQPDEEDESMSLWELFRRRWALLLSFALVVFFAATMFLPSLGHAKRKAQMVSARYNLMEIGTALRMYAEDNRKRLPASLDELTNELQLDLVNTILIDPQNGRRFVYVGAGKSLDSLQSNSLLAYSPVDKKGRAGLFADGRVEVLSGARFSELTNRGLSDLVAAKDAERRQFATTPVAAAPQNPGQLKSEGDRDKSKSADLAISSRNNGELAAKTPAAPAVFASSSQDLFRNAGSPANATTVLVTFRVQQSGNSICIVDADGSIYDGSLLSESAVAQNELIPAATPAPLVAAATDVVRATIVTNQVESKTTQNHLFRVSGTNQTLKQNVVFTGNLLTISVTNTNLRQSFNGISGIGGGGGGAGGQPQPALTNQLPWSISRIAGTAVIGDTTTIEINAVPLSP